MEKGNIVKFKLVQASSLVLCQQPYNHTPCSCWILEAKQVWALSSCCWKWCWWASRGVSSLWLDKSWRHRRFYYAVEATVVPIIITLRPGLTVGIKDPRTLFVQSRFPGYIPNPALSICHLIIPGCKLANIVLSLSTSADVWWAFWHKMSAVVLPRWVLHAGGGLGDFPSHHCIVLWVWEKWYINATINKKKVLILKHA